MFSLSACRVFYPDLMFKTDPEFQFDKPDSSQAIIEHVLQPGDEITMSILSNNGYQLVDVIGTNAISFPINYKINVFGYATLPLLDSIQVSGMTLLQLEKELESRYSYYFLNPFIKVEVVNRRALVYTGRSVGKVITLTNDRTQLIEVITEAGGITGNKAFRVKLIRGDLKKPNVYLFDFSTIEGLKQSDFLVQNLDIIYVEPSLTLSDVNSKILPIVSTITTILLIYTTLNRAQN